MCYDLRGGRQGAEGRQGRGDSSRGDEETEGVKLQVLDVGRGRMTKEISKGWKREKGERRG